MCSMLNLEVFWKKTASRFLNIVYHSRDLFV